MATQNGRVSRDPPLKRPRLSYNGYQPERVPYQALTENSQVSGAQLSMEPVETEKAQWLWNFSRNIFDGLVEGSKMAMEGLKSVGSFLMGNQGPWIPAEQNGSFDDDDYAQAPNPGQKRKRGDNGWQSINLQSELSLAHHASTSTSHNSNGKDESSSERRNIFETPWTNPTQKEALMKSYGSKSSQGLARTPSRNVQSASFSGVALSPAKSSVNDVEMDGILEASFNEELEPSGEAVLSASPERISAAEESRPQGSALCRSPLKNFSEKRNTFLPDLVQQTARSLSHRPEMFFQTKNETVGQGNHFKSNFCNEMPQKNVTSVDAEENEEPFSGHIETEQGVRDSHDGRICDAFDLAHAHHLIHQIESVGENENDDEGSDGQEEEDEKEDGEEEEEEEDEEEEDGDEEDETGEDLGTVSSSEDEEEDASDRSYGLVAELATDPVAASNYQMENVHNVAKNPVENSAQFVSESSSQPNIIPSSLPTEKNEPLDPFAVNFFSAAHVGNFSGDLSSSQLENENGFLSLSSQLENGFLPPSASQFQFGDHSEVIVADEEIYEDESEEEEVEQDEDEEDEDEEDSQDLETAAAVDESNSSDEIICEGIYIGSQANLQQNFVFEGSDAEQDEEGQPEDDESYESESGGDSEEEENVDDDAEGSR